MRSCVHTIASVPPLEEFEGLFGVLVKLFPYTAIPPLPPKKATGRFEVVTTLAFLHADTSMVTHASIGVIHRVAPPFP